MIRRRVVTPFVMLVFIVAAFFAGYFVGRPSPTARPCVSAVKTGAGDAVSKCRDALANAIHH